MKRSEREKSWGVWGEWYNLPLSQWGSGQSLGNVLKFCFSLLSRGLETEFSTSLEDEKIVLQTGKSKGTWPMLQHILQNTIKYWDKKFSKFWSSKIRLPCFLVQHCFDPNHASLFLMWYVFRVSLYLIFSLLLVKQDQASLFLVQHCFGPNRVSLFLVWYVLQVPMFLVVSLFLVKQNEVSPSLDQIIFLCFWSDMSCKFPCFWSNKIRLPCSLSNTVFVQIMFPSFWSDISSKFLSFKVVFLLLEIQGV